MELLEKSTLRDALFLGGGVLLALFGWDMFRLMRQATGAAVGAVFGFAVFVVVGVPGTLADLGFTPLVWAAALIGVLGLVGYLLLRRVRTLGAFFPGVLLGFLSGKMLYFWLGGKETLWSLSPIETLLGGIAGGVAVLIHERISVIVMTAALGSYLAGSVLPWKLAPFFFFVFFAPLQWWVQAGRPIPFKRSSG